MKNPQTETTGTRKITQDPWFKGRSTDELLGVFNLYADELAKLDEHVRHAVLSDDVSVKQHYLAHILGEQVKAKDPRGTFGYAVQHIVDACLGCVRQILYNEAENEAKKIYDEKIRQNPGQKIDFKEVLDNVINTIFRITSPYILDTRFVVVTEPFLGNSYDILRIKIDERRNMSRECFEFSTKKDAENNLERILKG